MKRIGTMGELLVDFVPLSQGVYAQKFGGAPGNVAATVAILGGNSVFYGAVGNDIFGNFLIDEIKTFGVDASHIIKKDDVRTGITFVTNDQAGERSFLFYRNPSADMLYSKEDFLDNPGHIDIFAFSSVSLIDYPIKDAHLAMINKAKSEKGIVVFDANLRIHLWKDQAHYKEVVTDFIRKSDILKVSSEELAWITDSKDEFTAINYLRILGPKVIIITKGSDGVDLYLRDEKIHIQAYKVGVVDTTGAGDAFLGAFLYKLSLNDKDYLDLDITEYINITRFANAVAALSTTKQGAVSAVPDLETANLFIQDNYLE